MLEVELGNLVVQPLMDERQVRPVVVRLAVLVAGEKVGVVLGLFVAVLRLFLLESSAVDFELVVLFFFGFEDRFLVFQAGRVVADFVGLVFERFALINQRMRFRVSRNNLGSPGRS